MRSDTAFYNYRRISSNFQFATMQFSSQEFTIMLFHYDGVVAEWGNLPWSVSALHVSAVNQTKW